MFALKDRAVHIVTYTYAAINITSGDTRQENRTKKCSNPARRTMARRVAIFDQTVKLSVGGGTDAKKHTTNELTV